MRLSKDLSIPPQSLYPVPLKFSFLMLSSQVTPKKNLNTVASRTSSSASCRLYSIQRCWPRHHPVNLSFHFQRYSLLLFLLFTQTLFFRRPLISSECFLPFGPVFYTVKSKKSWNLLCTVPHTQGSAGVYMQKQLFHTCIKWVGLTGV